MTANSAAFATPGIRVGLRHQDISQVPYVQRYVHGEIGEGDSNGDRGQCRQSDDCECDREGRLDEVCPSEPRPPEEVERLKDKVDGYAFPHDRIEGIEERMTFADKEQIKRLDDDGHHGAEHQEVGHQTDGDGEETGQHLLQRRSGQEQPGFVSRLVVERPERPAGSHDSPDEQRSGEQDTMETWPVMEVGAEGVAGGGNHGREENDPRQRTRNHQQGTVAGDEIATQQVPESARGDSVVHA